MLFLSCFRLTSEKFKQFCKWKYKTYFCEIILKSCYFSWIKVAEVFLFLALVATLCSKVGHIRNISVPLTLNRNTSINENKRHRSTKFIATNKKSNLATKVSYRYVWLTLSFGNIFWHTGYWKKPDCFTQYWKEYHDEEIVVAVLVHYSND